MGGADQDRERQGVAHVYVEKRAREKAVRRKENVNVRTKVRIEDDRVRHEYEAEKLLRERR